ncbi:sensor histidine kinase [Dyadobacter endophyticus]|nr:ATP-binding protein [Dyadobacter endophyticus]
MYSTTTCFKLAFALLFTVSVRCLAQDTWPTDSAWEAIRMKHKTGRMHDTVYLAYAQALTELSFKNPLLKERLANYKSVAWSNPAYQAFRVKYYAFLANHASAVHQDGYAIYYLQKMEEELKMTRPYIASLNEPRQLLSIYGDKGNYNYERRMAIIDSLTPFLKTLPAALAKGPVNINTCVNAFTILKHAVSLYTTNHNNAKAIELADAARALWLQLKRKPVTNKGKLVQCQLSLYLIEAHAAKVMGQVQKQADYLNAAYGIIVSNDTEIAPLFKQPFSSTILTRIIDYHIEKKQIDSAAYFLRLYQLGVNKPNQAKNLDGTKILRYIAKVDAAKGNYQSAYENLTKGYAINDSVIAIRVADIHNNMYAHLVSEQRNETLLAQQIKIARRNNLIFGIVTILVVSVAAFLWLLKINREKAERQTRMLNESAQIQIAQLEYQAHEIQKRFGMELHDDVAGKLVNLVNYIESEELLEENDRIKDKLSGMSKMAREAYSSIRFKSHEWYLNSSDSDKKSFSERVRHIVAMALPDRSYEKQIEIDDRCLEKIDIRTRIQMLKIIQEAVANILKHAKARNFKLFIYEDEDAVILQIADNGHGFDPAATGNKKGMGLASMRERAQGIGGSIEISSSLKGTKLLLTIPSS